MLALRRGISHGVSLLGAAALALPAAAQSAATASTLTFNPGSTVKVEQLLGDQDYQTRKPTASQNATVQFAGLISPGLFQFNVTVPDSVPQGDQIVKATYGGTSTQPATLLTIYP